jgi:hypothetical protein
VSVRCGLSVVKVSRALVNFVVYWHLDEKNVILKVMATSNVVADRMGFSTYESPFHGIGESIIRRLHLSPFCPHIHQDETRALLESARTRPHVLTVGYDVRTQRIAGLVVTRQHATIPYGWEVILKCSRNIPGVLRSIMMYTDLRIAKKKGQLMSAAKLAHHASLAVRKATMKGEPDCDYDIFTSPFSVHDLARLEIIRRVALRHDDNLCQDAINLGYVEDIFRKVMTGPESWIVICGHTLPRRRVWSHSISGYCVARVLKPDDEFSRVPKANIPQGVLLYLVCSIACSGKSMIRLLKTYLHSMRPEPRRFIFLESVPEKFRYYLQQFGAFCVDSRLLQNQSIALCKLLRSIPSGSVHETAEIKRRKALAKREEADIKRVSRELSTEPKSGLIPMAIDAHSAHYMCSSSRKPGFVVHHTYGTRLINRLTMGV